MYDRPYERVGRPARARWDHRPDDRRRDHDEGQHHDERDGVVHVTEIDPVHDRGRGDPDDIH